MRLSIALLLVFPLAALAEREPYVVKGPAILGVRPTEAWVTWGTSHHQGKAAGVECREGTANGGTPTLTLYKGDAVKGRFEDPACSRMHHVHLTGLEAATAYRFTLDRPFASGGAPAQGSFTTAPAAGGGTVHFVVYGDNRDNPISEKSTRPGHESVVKGILAHEADAAFLLHTGDAALNLTGVSGDDRGYTEFFDVERPLLASRPLAMAFGNHESIDPEYYDGLLSAASLEGAAHPHYYSMDWGIVHVAVLDSFEGPAQALAGGQHDPLVTDAQAKWLDADLTAASAKGQKLFLIAHQGAYSHGPPRASHGGSPDVQKKVVPLMVKHHVLAIFAGHDHYYQRGHEGCVDYAVVGSGGAPAYEPDAKAPGVAAVHKASSYLAVTVTADGAKGEAKEADGTVFDRFDFTPAACPAK